MLYENKKTLLQKNIGETRCVFGLCDSVDAKRSVDCPNGPTFSLKTLHFAQGEVRLPKMRCGFGKLNRFCPKRAAAGANDIELRQARLKADTQPTINKTLQSLIDTSY